MKKITIALATVLALTGASFAGGLDAAPEATKQVNAPVSVDLTKTHSISDEQQTSKPRLGYEGSPWFIVR